MSKAFPTHKQFIAAVRARLYAAYPYERGPRMHDTVKTRTGEQQWLKHLGDQMKAGVPAEARVLNTMDPRLIYALRTLYAPEGSLDGYLATHRHIRGDHGILPILGGVVLQTIHDDIVVSVPESEAASVISCFRPTDTVSKVAGRGDEVDPPLLPHNRRRYRDPMSREQWLIKMMVDPTPTPEGA